MNSTRRKLMTKTVTTVLTSIGIVALAAIVTGIVIALSGRDPFQTYEAILSGAGLGWFVPGQSISELESAAYGLQQTLVILIPLVLLGFAVAVPFKAGFFNIGGQGQYFAGSFAALIVGSSLHGLPPAVHMILAVVCGALAAATWGAIAGYLRAYLGASEVIVTIMLNYVAIWAGSALFGIGGPLQSRTQPTQPVSNSIAESAKMPIIWGEASLQGLHAGILVIPVVMVLVWILFNRTKMGFETTAVGTNQEASRYLGIRVQHRSASALVIGGAIAGIAGALDLLGWQFHISVSDLPVFQLGFVGIAVALLGRNTPVGILFSAALFAVLISGTSSRNLDPDTFPPELASYLALIGQAVIILLVSLDASRGTQLFAQLRNRTSWSKKVAS